ncbi:MAG: hypothetical protein DRJ51_04525 [Thermoprotei archaeon]|nr:MAG: hypothetical protein DRJ51_04525 [Thermoprotei archaeon]
MLMERGNVPLTDLHMHSQFSPCGVDVDIYKDTYKAFEKGLKIIAITDHGTSRRPSWIKRYFKVLESINPPVIVLPGIEVDVNLKGEFVVERDVLKKFKVILAALHKLPDLKGESLYKWWRDTMIKISESGAAQIIAHPTDIGWHKVNVPPEYCLEVIDAIKENGLIVELNYHHADPLDPFLKLCIKNGVKLTPTSDAHKLKEIGHLNWHVAKIRGLGFALSDVNWLSEREIISIFYDSD